jgi:Leucine-rich repeat (LRR) protein
MTRSMISSQCSINIVMNFSSTTMTVHNPLPNDETLLQWWSAISHEHQVWLLNNMRHAINQAEHKPQAERITDQELTTEYIRAIKQATELDFTGSYPKTVLDISALQYCTNLTKLSIGNYHIEDLTSLRFLTNLTELSLEENNLTDAHISALQYCPQLETLYLTDHELLTDISVLRYCVHLQTLSLVKNRIKSIAPLQYCTQLKELFLWDNCIEDISALQYCTALEHLCLCDNNIKALSALQHCTQLQDMCLSHIERNDIQILLGLPALKEVTYPSYAEHQEELIQAFALYRPDVDISF